MANGLYEYIEISDLKDMLEKSGELYGENIAYKIKNDDKYITFTHKEVREMINNLGTRLIDLGLKDKRIAVLVKIDMSGKLLIWQSQLEQV